ncbi:MAG: acylphosphatase [Minisyncoccia bacterium]
MERLEALVSGRVQIVMYRDFTCRKARGLGLVGSVQNLPDGTVRVIAEGPRASLEKLALKLWKGSLFSRVDMVQTTYAPATGEFPSFRIIYV